MGAGLEPGIRAVYRHLGPAVCLGRHPAVVSASLLESQTGSVSEKRSAGRPGPQRFRRGRGLAKIPLSVAGFLVAADRDVPRSVLQLIRRNSIRLTVSVLVRVYNPIKLE